MLPIISNCWALFLGMGLIMLGNGLQGTLLGVRASMEDFGTTLTGIVMSGYFLGLILGCRRVPKMVLNVGHIRTFGALASLASTSILVQAVFVNPPVWWCMRLVTGFSYAGLYIVAESWLNEAADNGSRGKLLSIYMVVSLAGLAGGQLLLNISSPDSYELFVLSSLLISIAVIPILLSTARAPQFELMENISIIQLYRVTPLGVVGMLMNGMCYGAIFGMGAVYGTEVGMTAQQVSLFMGALVVGGFVLQYPLGWVSDSVGRSKVIIFASLAGGCASLYAIFLPESGLLQYFLIAVIGGLTMPLYALCGVHTNDYLTPTQMVAASGTLVLLSATGATIGSPLTAFAMDFYGPSAFYASLAVMMLFISIFAAYRSQRRGEVKDERGKFVVIAPTPLSASLNPEVELDELEAAMAEDGEQIKESFEELVEEMEQSDTASQ
ncbi:MULTISPECIES: MFS transporter [Desulfosediminicola]|uniref:MFS transporter n=1 Tax=Desulfosediminicola TaxID=2886823 RepID=UPI0010AB8FB4|nr:MFS transporter [Desulfosediminicola ganghwensis]